MVSPVLEGIYYSRNSLFKHPYLLFSLLIQQLLAQHALWSVFDTAHFAFPCLWNTTCTIVSCYITSDHSTILISFLLCYSFPAFFGFGSLTQFDQAQPTPEALTQGITMIKVTHTL